MFAHLTFPNNNDDCFGNVNLQATGKILNSALHSNGTVSLLLDKNRSIIYSRVYSSRLTEEIIDMNALLKIEY